ncbi:Uncharacterized protein DBV15_02137, partial [Temnothorax longispinosus]
PPRVVASESLLTRRSTSEVLEVRYRGDLLLLVRRRNDRDVLVVDGEFLRIARRAILSAPDFAGTSTMGPLGIARNCSRRKRYSRQGDAKERERVRERGMRGGSAGWEASRYGNETNGDVEHQR